MELTRKELYDLVWSEPMTTICKRFGLSDNGLRKRCKSMNIPTPPLGYWAKLKYGKQVTPLPFQQEETNATQSTTLQEAKEPKVEMEKSVNPYKQRELEICSGDISCFKVPEVLYAKNPLIIDTKEKFRQRSENQYLKKNILDTILMIVLGASVYLIILFFLKDKFLIENAKLALNKVIRRRKEQ